MCLAIPGKLLSIAEGNSKNRTGKVSFGGIIKEVSLLCCPEAKVGDYVLVHVGFAISTIDEEEARKVFAHLKRMDELRELEEANG
ncbi:MAG: HypC/HybG/HupF family hydrogenase formation chaperone [Candidatus Micrarchaeota archaeon]|nr:HypC/HybG/HupF family hydrogenase formation chaperone [Candidatus Micrarchaeota archaeon]